MTEQPPHLKPVTVERFAEASKGNHHEWLGFVITSVTQGFIEADMLLGPHHLNPGGTIHGGVTSSFADSLSAYGLYASLPEGAVGFTTVNLSTQFLGRAGLGDTVTGVARLVQGGRQMQTWDTEITCSETLVAVARVTQLLRYPK